MRESYCGINYQQKLLLSTPITLSYKKAFPHASLVFPMIHRWSVGGPCPMMPWVWGKPNGEQDLVIPRIVGGGGWLCPSFPKNITFSQPVAVGKEYQIKTQHYDNLVHPYRLVKWNVVRTVVFIIFTFTPLYIPSQALPVQFCSNTQSWQCWQNSTASNGTKLKTVTSC